MQWYGCGAIVYQTCKKILYSILHYRCWSLYIDYRLQLMGDQYPDVRRSISLSHLPQFLWRRSLSHQVKLTRKEARNYGIPGFMGNISESLHIVLVSSFTWNILCLRVVYLISEYAGRKSFGETMLEPPVVITRIVCSWFARGAIAGSLRLRCGRCMPSYIYSTIGHRP